jgi:hypothetical protein
MEVEMRMFEKTKDEMEEAADRWEAIANEKGYRCERCGSIPPCEERKTYFSTKLCGWCLNQDQKDN